MQFLWRKNIRCLGLIFLLSLFPSVYGKNISLSYPEEISYAQTFEITLSLIDFPQDNYDLKIDIFGEGKRISRIFNEKWKSTNYYIQNTISDQSQHTFLLNISEQYEGTAQITIKVKDTKEAVSLFQSYDIEIIPQSTKEKEEKLSADEKTKEIFVKQNYTPQPIRKAALQDSQVIEVILQPSKDIKSQTDSGKIIYKSKTQYIKDYVLYAFALFWFIVLIILLFRLKKQNDKNNRSFDD